MLYLIGGAARAGKTILTHRLFNTCHVPYLCLDYVVGALDRGAPELGIDSEAPNIPRTLQVWPRIEPLLRNIAEVEPAYTVEGDVLLPAGVAALQADYGSNIRACFIGYAEITPQDKLAEIRAFGGEVNDWIQKHSDAYILNLCEDMIGFSRFARAECKIYDIPYFDVSANFLPVLGQAFLLLTA